MKTLLHSWGTNVFVRLWESLVFVVDQPSQTHTKLPKEVSGLLLPLRAKQGKGEMLVLRPDLQSSRLAVTRGPEWVGTPTNSSPAVARAWFWPGFRGGCLPGCLRTPQWLGTQKVPEGVKVSVYYSAVSLAYHKPIQRTQFILYDFLVFNYVFFPCWWALFPFFFFFWFYFFFLFKAVDQFWNLSFFMDFIFILLLGFHLDLLII